jgi:glycosyltransferase involved in cell wall biosynthesis
VVVAIADALSSTCQVDIVHHKPGLTKQTLSEYYGFGLDAVELREVPYDDRERNWNSLPQRFIHERSKLKDVTRDYDLFIASIYDIPPFCHARRGALFVHFPLFDLASTWPWLNDGGGLKGALRRRYANFEWQQRLSGYQLILTNSQFTAKYIKDWWGMDSTVVYAPAKIDFPLIPKVNRILSVGRFATVGTSKNQLELVGWFGNMEIAPSDEWEYHCVGGLAEAQADHRYFDRVVEVGSTTGAIVRANLSRTELDRLYATSKVFWHAAGFGDRDISPALTEHFGIITVEAMGAGCVPVVYAQGGQPEIVEHGINGFLWNSPEELINFTELLIADADLLRQMSVSARKRAGEFGGVAFEARIRAALQPLLNQPKPI